MFFVEYWGVQSWGIKNSPVNSEADMLSQSWLIFSFEMAYLLPNRNWALMAAGVRSLGRPGECFCSFFLCCCAKSFFGSCTSKWGGGECDSWSTLTSSVYSCWNAKVWGVEGWASQSMAPAQGWHSCLTSATFRGSRAITWLKKNPCYSLRGAASDHS